MSGGCKKTRTQRALPVLLAWIHFERVLGGAPTLPRFPPAPPADLTPLASRQIFFAPPALHRHQTQEFFPGRGRSRSSSCCARLNQLTHAGQSILLHSRITFQDSSGSDNNKTTLISKDSETYHASSLLQRSSQWVYEG